MSRPLPSPPRIPRNASWRDVDYAALDFETTGLDLANDAIVSFGVVPVRRGRAMIGRSTHQLVRPRIPPSPRSQTIHELRPQDLAEAPGIETAIEGLREALDGCVVLAWFAEVELAFLSAVFDSPARRFRRHMLDVRDVAINVDGKPRSTRQDPGYALGAEARRWGVPVANPHEALDDAFVTAQLFLVLADRATNGGPASFQELRDIARPPRPPRRLRLTRPALG